MSVEDAHLHKGSSQGSDEASLRDEIAGLVLVLEFLFFFPDLSECRAVSVWGKVISEAEGRGVCDEEGDMNCLEEGVLHVVDAIYDRVPKCFLHLYHPVLVGRDCGGRRDAEEEFRSDTFRVGGALSKGCVGLRGTLLGGL